MDSLIKVQDDIVQRISKARTNFKKSLKDRMVLESYLSTRLRSLEQLWSEFNTNHTSIVQGSDSSVFKTHLYFVSDAYETCEELYTTYSCEILEALSKIKSAESTSNRAATSASSVSANIRLPKMNIPTFSGLYSEWISFCDLFTSLVRNNDQLDNIQKLHYLKCHLSGEAEQLLRHIPITQDNFLWCWTQLENRYENKRFLTNSILKRFMSQNNISTESASALREMLDCTNECLYALQNIGINVTSWDTIVIYILCQKLDTETRKQWELKRSELANDMPTLDQFREFLEKRSRALEFIDPELLKPHSHVVQVNHVITSARCMYCSADHKIYNCKQFGKTNVDTRREFAQSNRLCFNCLSQGHPVYSCRHISRCRICKRKHHSLLHPKKATTTSTSLSNLLEPSKAFQTDTKLKDLSLNNDSQVLLPTALVNAHSESGSLATLRCLLDQGSQASFITEAAVQRLGLKQIAHRSSIIGLGSDEKGTAASAARVSLHVQSLYNPDNQFRIQAFVLDKITSTLPQKQFKIESGPDLTFLKLADPSFNKPNHIDVLLGADVYGQILLEGIIKGQPSSPVAQNTKLGWILSGPIYIPEGNAVRSHCAHVAPESNSLKLQPVTGLAIIKTRTQLTSWPPILAKDRVGGQAQTD